MTEKMGKTEQHMEKAMILGCVMKPGTGETVV